ncbi:MAG: twin-arginine translocase subunit TatB [Candidatus Accumulibacter sp.]|nr:twin-arginine translocase subunit TatB [Accumulibacter sp.]
MFDISFTEMILIAVVALIVIGPERLPKVARTAGHLLGRLQRYVSDVKADINREIQLDELKKLQAEIQESARSVEQSLNSEMLAARQAVAQTAQALDREVKAAAESSQAEAGTPATTGGPAPAAQPPAAPGAPDKPGGTA